MSKTESRRALAESISGAVSFLTAFDVTPDELLRRLPESLLFKLEDALTEGVKARKELNAYEQTQAVTERGR